MNNRHLSFIVLLVIAIVALVIYAPNKVEGFTPGIRAKKNRLVRRLRRTFQGMGSKLRNLIVRVGL